MRQLLTLSVVLLAACKEPVPEKPIPPAVCDNGLDDDDNGLYDCQDDACPACAEHCFDAVDNDRDLLADCADTDCAEVCVEDCGDFVDNDRDGKEDCHDSDCDGERDVDGDGHLRLEAGGDDRPDDDPQIYP